MQVDGLLRVNRSSPTNCCSAATLDHRPEPARQTRRGSPRTVTASASAGTATATARTPAVFKSTHPAWNDREPARGRRPRSAHRCCSHTSAPRAGRPVQRSNCHPFRYGRWLWMHNGSLAGFQEVKRDLMMAVDPSLFPDIEGSTDTETLFFLALTFGLADDPPTAVARAVGLVEDVGQRHGVEYPVHMTVATSDGESIWAFRYSSEKSHELALLLDRRLPGAPAVSRAGDARPPGSRRALDRLEPLRDLPGAWNEVPEGSWALVRRGEHEITQPFEPSGRSVTRPDDERGRDLRARDRRADAAGTRGAVRARRHPVGRRPPPVPALRRRASRRWVADRFATTARPPCWGRGAQFPSAASSPPPTPRRRSCWSGRGAALRDPRPERERGPAEIADMALTEALFLQEYAAARR